MNKLTVLCVEDEARSRRVMQLLLSGRLGINTILFENSENFQELAEALDPKPNLVFLDIHIEPLDGFEMLKILRQSPAYAKIPVIALTASVMNEEIQQLQLAGFDGCIGKPINIDSFPKTLEAILAGETIWQILS